jgi:2-aminoethylphosphonate-pyruvate transaminase
MKKLGLRPYLNPSLQSHIITSFFYPADPKFTFLEFYQKLSDKGFIIYPGKISRADTFRIGSIGRIFESDIRSLLAAVAETMTEMGIISGA